MTKKLFCWLFLMFCGILLAPTLIAASACGEEVSLPTSNSQPRYERSDCGLQCLVVAQQHLRAWLTRLDSHRCDQAGFPKCSKSLRRALAGTEKVVVCLSLTEWADVEKLEILKSSGQGQLDARLAKWIQAASPFERRPKHLVGRNKIMLVFTRDGLNVDESTVMTKNRNIRIGEFTGGPEDFE